MRDNGSQPLSWFRCNVKALHSFMQPICSWSVSWSRFRIRHNTFGWRLHKVRILHLSHYFSTRDSFQNEVCFIGGNCVTTGDLNPDDESQACLWTVDRFGWTTFFSQSFSLENFKGFKKCSDLRISEHMKVDKTVFFEVCWFSEELK